jgi:uncharacterized protein (TIGR02118 family)
LSLGRVERS